MKTNPCPECGSTEIISDLTVFSDEMAAGAHPPFVQLVEPKPEKASFMWMPKKALTGFSAAICCSCGYTRFYAKNYKDLLEAQKKGYVREKGTSPVVPL